MASPAISISYSTPLKTWTRTRSDWLAQEEDRRRLTGLPSRSEERPGTMIAKSDVRLSLVRRIDRAGPVYLQLIRSESAYLSGWHRGLSCDDLPVDQRLGIWSLPDQSYDRGV